MGAAHSSMALADFLAALPPTGTGLSCVPALPPSTVPAQMGRLGRRVAGRASPRPVRQSSKGHDPSGLAQLTTPASQHLWNREHPPTPPSVQGPANPTQTLMHPSCVGSQVKFHFLLEALRDHHTLEGAVPVLS